jgi:hypothetical protein
MKYAVEMGAGALIYIPSFMKIVSAIHRHRHRHRDSKVTHKPTLILENKKSGLKVILLRDCEPYLTCRRYVA